MKIAFLRTANNPHVINRMKYFLKNGHEVFCFSPPYVGGATVPQGVKLYVFNPPHIVSRFKTAKVIYNALFVRRISKEHKIDILHVMWLGYAVYGVFAKVKAIVLENMGSDVLVWPKQSLLWRIFLRFIYIFGNAVIQDSRISQEAGIKYGAKKENNHIIEVGVNFDIFNQHLNKGIARERLNLSENQKMVFSPRSFTPLYNIETIIRSIKLVNAKVPDVVYVFCKFFGDLDREFEQLIKSEGVEKQVLFAGFLDNEKELPYFYRDADVVVSVPTSDSSPMTVYEAMACGTPCVVSELPWLKNKFENGRELLAVPVKDTDKLADAITKLLLGQQQLDIEMASNKVFKDINSGKENKKLEDLYTKILQIETSVLLPND